tara:strand:+ start:91 stop:447 length:357 start_codon:yes stop_codon:yes gene_type:complete
MSSYDTTTAKGRILREFQGDFMGVNEPLRRYFRLWLDGSYLGEDHYRKNVDYITKNAHNKKAIRSFVISEFCKYTAHDADCSPSYAQKVIVKGILPDYLERLTDVLIYDAYDLCEENA